MPLNAGMNFGGVSAALLLPFRGPLVGTTSILAVAVMFQLIFIPLMCVPGVHDLGMALAFSGLAGIGISFFLSLS